MKIVNILGALGNQMFEYAFFLALKERHPNERILCSTRSFKGYSLHNGLELERLFNINIKEATIWELAKLAYPFFDYKSWQLMCHFFKKRKSMAFCNMYTPFDYWDIERVDSVFYDGYWQNEKYFLPIREKILEIYKFPVFTEPANIELSLKIMGTNSVSCHIRRGDYLREPKMCVCTPLYYERAINEINQRVKPDLYIIFSDDVEWCRSNLKDLVGDKELVYVNWNQGSNSYRDLQLMTICKHNIIANSSFSWWGAWLNQNPNKIVISPKCWKKDNINNDPICESWNRINCE